LQTAEKAARRFIEFFTATLRKQKHSHGLLLGYFFAWVERLNIGELADIEPINVAFRATGITAYLDAGGTLERPGVGRTREPVHDKALRPHERRDHARRSRADRDMKRDRVGGTGGDRTAERLIDTITPFLTSGSPAED
jgi:hypothetical protein